MNSNTRSPIIVIGMHRSGTSLLTQMLEALGLFMGWRKDKNSEGRFFLQFNEWLLYIGGGSWGHPSCIHGFLEDKATRALTVDYIQHILETPRIISFLGVDKYLRYRTPANLDIPWGWKDPRNTYTLPIWLDVFPQAQVVHICRHGVDVASSLMRRREEIWAETVARHERRKRFLLYWFKRKRGGFVGTSRCRSLEDSFSLWEEHMQEARGHVSSLGPRAIEFKYEDLLENPRLVLKAVAEFGGVSVGQAALDRVARLVRLERAYAYRVNPELRAFADQVAERLKAQGY